MPLHCGLSPARPVMGHIHPAPLLSAWLYPSLTLVHHLKQKPHGKSMEWQLHVITALDHHVIVCTCRCYRIQHCTEQLKETVYIYNLMTWCTGPLAPDLLFDPLKVVTLQQPSLPPPKEQPNEKETILFLFICYCRMKNTKGNRRENSNVFVLPR